MMPFGKKKKKKKQRKRAALNQDDGDPHLLCQFCRLISRGFRIIDTAVLCDIPSISSIVMSDTVGGGGFTGVNQ